MDPGRGPILTIDETRRVRHEGAGCGGGCAEYPVKRLLVIKHQGQVDEDQQSGNA